MKRPSLDEPQAGSRPRPHRFGVVARVGVFAGAGIALLSVAASSASACPIRARSVLRTHQVAVDADDVVTRPVAVDADAVWPSRHLVRSPNLVTARPADPPAPSRPADPPVYASRPAVAVAVTSSSLGGVWACIRSHESGGNYAINTGNGYYGAYQFSLSTWRSVGGSGLPSQASPAEQDMLAQILQARSGWGQWPVTSRMCGV
jgi:hypothetical protein